MVVESIFWDPSVVSFCTIEIYLLLRCFLARSLKISFEHLYLSAKALVPLPCLRTTGGRGLALPF